MAKVIVTIDTDSFEVPEATDRDYIFQGYNIMRKGIHYTNDKVITFLPPHTIVNVKIDTTD